jgi:hypothetical protein
MLIVLYSRDNGEIEDIGVFESKESFEEWLPRQLRLNPDTKILKKAESWEEFES